MPHREPTTTPHAASLRICNVRLRRRGTPLAGRSSAPPTGIALARADSAATVCESAGGVLQYNSATRCARAVGKRRASPTGCLGEDCLGKGRGKIHCLTRAPERRSASSAALITVYRYIAYNGLPKRTASLLWTALTTRGRVISSVRDWCKSTRAALQGEPPMADKSLEDRLTAAEDALHSLGSTLVTGEHDNHSGFMSWLRARLVKSPAPAADAPAVAPQPEAPAASAAAPAPATQAPPQ